MQSFSKTKRKNHTGPLGVDLLRCLFCGAGSCLVSCGFSGLEIMTRQCSESAVEKGPGARLGMPEKVISDPESCRMSRSLPDI